MRYSGITIAMDDISTFTPAFQNELRAYAFKGLPLAEANATAHTEDGDEEDEEEGSAVEMGPVQAKRFLEGCREKTISALKVIVGKEDGFTADDIAADLGIPADQLRGVWGGLTKRARTVTKIEGALLIDWYWNASEDAWQGSMKAKTRASLEAALRDY